MKIGILTFVNTSNYGASLQAYSLLKIILSLGHECEIINYHNQLVSNGHDPKVVFKRHGIKKLASPLLYFVYKKRLDKFKDFEEKYCQFSEYCDHDTIQLICEKYDKIIVGSDQVWNTEITGGDKVYFLDFLSDDTKKYSYAASVGTGDFIEDGMLYDELIKKFQIISIRESDTVQKIRTRIGRDDVFCDIDPTILLSDKWGKFVLNNKYSKDYIFMYLVPETDELLNAVRKLAKKNNDCKIILLKKGAGKRKGIKIINVASPIDFINYIAHAKCIISGSFHALCFSLMLEKDFYATSAKQSNRNGRLYNLLDLFDLRDRYLELTNIYFNEKIIDYKRVRCKMKELSDKSMRTIKMICDQH